MFFSGVQGPFSRWPSSGWIRGDVASLVRCIELAAVSEHHIANGLDVLENLVLRSDRLLETRGSENMHRKFGEVLHQEPGIQTSRMALAILSNAFVFHATIGHTYDLPSFQDLRGETNLVSPGRLLGCWRFVLEEINYWPIFKIASDLVECLDLQLASRIFDWMIEGTEDLIGIGTATIHDLAGRMFQQLIADRKFLATFYTLPTSAALLAELAVGRLQCEWSKPSTVTNLKIADLACGTGTLLTAAYQSLLRRYRHSGQNDEAIHTKMVEECLLATDIMPAATHLTASQLAGVHPAKTFKRTNVYTMPYGEQPEESAYPLAIGSLNLTTSDRWNALWGTGSAKVLGDRADELSELHLPEQSLDLVIMNPPFTRPTNHEIAEVPVPSFAGFNTSADEQKAMSDQLSIIRRKLKSPMGNGYAGLASNFLDLAHAKIRPGGTLAFVLPKTFLRGTSWKSAREVLLTEYRDVCIVSIKATASTHSAFSADTGMAEVLLIATRREPEESHESNKVLFINLPKRPGSMNEAVELARQIVQVDERESGEVTIGDEQAFDFFRTSIENAGVAGVASVELATSMLHLISGSVVSPQTGNSFEIPLVRLTEIGECGPVHRKIGSKGTRNPRGPFQISGPHSASDYPVLWSHHAEDERQMLVKPDSRGVVRPGKQEEARTIWKTATRLHFNLDFRLTSQSLSACMTPSLTIGGTAWPSYRLTSEEWEKPVALWANSTLGLLIHWWTGSRQQSGRTRLTVTSLPSLLVLDPRKLCTEQLAICDNIFDEFASSPLLRAKLAKQDVLRGDLDKRLLIDVLGLSDEVVEIVAHLRNQWCAEPSVNEAASGLLARAMA